jgi:hypothetical protein
MNGETEVLFSLAGRTHVLLRREANRIIDVEWLCADAAYAREVIRLARKLTSDELHKLADRIEAVHPGLEAADHGIMPVPPQAETRYVGSLR